MFGIRSQLLIGLCIVSVFSLASALKCYQCITTDSKACNDSYLMDCPTDQAYDECSINFKKTAGNLIVVRKCVLGPCSLKSRDIPLSEKCDMSASDFLDCIHCCREDGCNKDSVNAIVPNKWLLYAFLLIALAYGSLSNFRLHS